MKQRKNTTILTVAVIMLIAGYNVYRSQKSDIMSKLLLSNVEAIADGFEFDGTLWDTEHHSYNDIWGTSDWKPVVARCSVTYGVDFGLKYEVTVDGEKVVCGNGNGNCIDGTSCVASEPKK